MPSATLWVPEAARPARGSATPHHLPAPTPDLVPHEEASICPAVPRVSCVTCAWLCSAEHCRGTPRPDSAPRSWQADGWSQHCWE